LGWVVKLDKPDFLGRAALQEAKTSGPRRRLVGLEITDRAIARNGFQVLKDGHSVGYVTSGTFAPSLEKSIALAYVSTEFSQIGSEFQIDVRGRIVAARAVPTPFYRRPK
jgi:aminomethyltransferase